MNLTSCQLQQMDLETWSCGQEGGADGRWRPSQTSCSTSQEGGADQGYNDVIDTLINAAFEQSVHVVMLIKEMVPQLNPACLFV